VNKTKHASLASKGSLGPKGENREENAGDRAILYKRSNKKRENASGTSYKKNQKKKKKQKRSK